MDRVLEDVWKKSEGILCKLGVKKNKNPWM